MKIKKILIANRGEIAVRIQKSAKSMGIRTVAIYSSKDANALHVLSCDEAYELHGESLAETYLNVDKIIDIAIKSGCDAIHPGYGFLSENPEFPKACKSGNIIFIGPGAEAISVMGNKLEARKLAEKIGVPITKGLTGSVDQILSQKETLSFPVLIKAASGGGGKGMRIVRSADILKESLLSTSREAKNYFGDGTVYVEKYIESPRHIEVQILADNFGNTIHLFERECSLQRRYQKIIEEAPSVTLTEKKRTEITGAAVKIAKEIRYSNAGTIEFLVDKNLNFYFLEMNTRIQVEHPVTEMITGIDIVKEQIKIALGEKLSLKQKDIHLNGHAIEARIYAEDPENNFTPSSGKMTLYSPPEITNTRLDSAYKDASEVFTDFDPMISKLIGYGQNRNEAITRLHNALENYHIHGITTNIQFLNHIINREEFIENKISTSFIENYLNELIEYSKQKNEFIKKVLSCAVLIATQPKDILTSVWETIGFWRAHNKLKFKIENNEYELNFRKVKQGVILKYADKEKEINNIRFKSNSLTFMEESNSVHCVYSFSDPSKLNIQINGFHFKVFRKDILDNSTKWENKRSNLNNNKTLFSPLPGKVVKIEVEEGQKVKKDDPLVIVEAMKMENILSATHDTKIKKINVTVGQQIDSEIPLIEFKE